MIYTENDNSTRICMITPKEGRLSARVISRITTHPDLTEKDETIIEVRASDFGSNEVIIQADKESFKDFYLALGKILFDRNIVIRESLANIPDYDMKGEKKYAEKYV